MISTIFYGFSVNFLWISNGPWLEKIDEFPMVHLAGAEDLQGRRIQLEAGGDRGDTSGVFKTDGFVRGYPHKIWEVPIKSH